MCNVSDLIISLLLFHTFSSFSAMSTKEEEREKSLFPKVKAEEEEEEEEEEEDLVDPAVAIKEACADEKCSKYRDRLNECNERVQSKSNTRETCVEEVIDFYHCVDHCAANKIFAVLK